MRAGSLCVAAVTWGVAWSSAQAHPIDTLAPGHWYEVPGSHLEPLFPSPRPAGNSGPEAVVNAWGGGGFDGVHERLFLWGGGHGDYGGNEIYAFDVETMKWSRPWGPEPVVTQIPAQCSSSYAGGTPSARHTYDGIEFIPSTGKMWATGGFRFCGNASTDNVTWLFDFGSLTWTQGANTLEAVGTPTSAWDPKGQRVLYQAQNLFQAYDPVTDRYSKLGEVDGGFWSTAVSAVDVAHDLFLSVANGKLRVWNLATRTFTSEQPTTGGGQALAGQPGVEWDPQLGRIVTWSGGTSVWSLDVASWTWFEHPAAATNLGTPPPPVPAGTFGRFRYMPARNAYVLVNKTSDNVYFYKLTSGGGVPVPSPPNRADAGAAAVGAVDSGGADSPSGAGSPGGGSSGGGSGCSCGIAGRPAGGLAFALFVALGLTICAGRSALGPRSRGRRKR